MVGGDVREFVNEAGGSAFLMRKLVRFDVDRYQ